MSWNWQKKDWPHFTYDSQFLQQFENDFLLRSGQLFGSYTHLDEIEKKHLTIDLISAEAVKTSEIEGELLNRESVQSSVRRQFGLQAGSDKSSPAEQGIAEMMVDLFHTFDEPLSQDLLFRWHKMLMKSHPNLREVGQYRSHGDPMQVVSGYIHERKVHFEAPESKTVLSEMKRFIKWYNICKLPALAKSGIIHLYFVSIHPFEDGNGRIARALSEKSLSESLSQPSLIGLSQTIQKERKKYYEALEVANKKNEVTEWLVYFSKTIFKAQALTEASIRIIISKTKFFDKFSEKLNYRQEKALLRLFKAGPEGFKGGLNAEKYISITKTTRATATRDLQELVAIGALTRTGELRHTRYWLEI